MPNPINPLANRLRPIARRVRRHADLALYQFASLFIATDLDGRLLGVMVLAGGSRDFVVSTVFDRRPTRRVVARWRGPLPRKGDYLMVPTRARSAYRIARDPVAPVASAASATVRLGLDIQRVALPLPAAAVVHDWRWTRGSREGAVIA